MGYTGPRQNDENIEKNRKNSHFSPKPGIFSKILFKAFLLLASTVSTKKGIAFYVNFEGCKAILKIVGWLIFWLFLEKLSFFASVKSRTFIATNFFNNFTLTLKINFNLLKVENGFEMVLLTFYYVFKRRICKKRHHFIVINTIFDQ